MARLERGGAGGGNWTLTVHPNQLLSESSISGDKPLSAQTLPVLLLQKPSGILGDAEINANQ